jgi:thiamine-monophosphate kinase
MWRRNRCASSRCKPRPVDEFDLIRRYFKCDAQFPGVVVGVGDDGAVLQPSPGSQQVQVTDTLVEGVHFPANISANDIGYRVVAVNLSDIAAMGATPRWMTLALTLWDKDESWVKDFAAGLLGAAAQYGVALVGGDTTQGDSVVVTVHVTGELEAGTAILRSGAVPGDTIFVSGTVGDAAAGLELIRQEVADAALVQRFLRPTPRIALGLLLSGRAHAAIDVSDGLVADLQKLLDASGRGAEIDIDRIPLSEALRERFDLDTACQFAMTGGDDYELCFTAPADAVAGIDGVTAIGTVTEGDALVCRRDGIIVEVDTSGYRHFA